MAVARQFLGWWQLIEAIGQLTGVVAHDFNNLLTVIIGTAETLVDEIADQRLSAVAQLNYKASRQGAALTCQLLTFAGRQPLEPTALNINSSLRAMGGIAVDRTWRNEHSAP